MAAVVFQSLPRTAAVCPARMGVRVRAEATPSSATAQPGSRADSVNCVSLCASSPHTHTQGEEGSGNVDHILANEQKERESHSSC